MDENDEWNDQIPDTPSREDGADRVSRRPQGRDYAQTTRMELLESLALGRKVILGIDTDIRASEYMRYKARHYGVKHVHKSLEGCLRELKDLMGGK